MPNHVTHTLMFPDADDYATFKRLFLDANDEFDFERIIPVPAMAEPEDYHYAGERLELMLYALKKEGIWDHERLDTAKAYIKSEGYSYIAKIIQLNQFNRQKVRQHAEAILAKIEMRYNPHTYENTAALEAGTFYANNFKKHGATNEKDWCIKNWNTKWNSYTNDHNDKQNHIYFNTANNDVTDLLLTAHKMADNPPFTVHFRDESGFEGCARYLKGDMQYIRL